jgi:hypothetical protein
VDLRAGLDDVEKRKFFTLPGLELRPLGRPASSQSLCRLRYPGSCHLLQTRRFVLGMNVRKSVKISEAIFLTITTLSPISYYAHEKVKNKQSLT